MLRGAVWLGWAVLCVGCEAKTGAREAPQPAPQLAPDVAPDVASARPAVLDMAEDDVGAAPPDAGASDAGADSGELGAFGVSGIGAGGSGPIEPPVAQRALPAGFKVELERVDIAGDLERELAGRLWRRGRQGLASCYAEALGRDDGVSGMLEVELVITQQGRVMASRVAPEGLADEALRRCVAAQMYRWVYPEARGLVRARHVMRFGR